VFYPINLSFVKKSDGSFVQSPIGTYQLSANAFGLFVDQEIILHDNFTDVDFNIASSNYSFIITEDLASFRSDRFNLHFNSSAIDDSVSILADSILCDTSPTYKIELKNAQKYVRYKIFVDGHEVSSYIPQQNDKALIELETKELSNGFITVGVKANNLCFTKDIKILTLWKQQTHLPNLFASTACNTKTTTLHIANSKGAIAFNWYDHENQLLSQTQDSSLIVSILKPTTFFASTIFDHGCVSQQANVHANVIQYDVPVITEDQGFLHSNYSRNNQWSLNGEEIVGATRATLEPITTGNYTLTISIDDCSDSANYYFIYQDDRFHVFPNPVENDLQIIPPKEEQIIQIEVINTSGQLVKTFFANQNLKTETISLHDLSPGIYLINVLSSISQYKVRVLKK
jgi:hypothetical protein